MSKKTWGIHADRAGIGTGKPDWYTLSSKMIKIHEGWRAEPYRDTRGNWTFGYGFLMGEDDDGRPVYHLSKDEGDAILDIKMRTAFHDAAHLFAGFGLLEHTRMAVLVEMRYQLGYAGIAGFVKLRAAVGRKDWAAAKREMLDSRWAEQTPDRARELADMMLNGDE